MACRNGDEASPRRGGGRAHDGSPALALPELEVTDETPDLLLTWVDEAGDFKVVERVEAVPEPARKAVRVVQTTRDDGTGEQVYVADLTAANGAGHYPVATWSRAEWEALGADKRNKRLEQLAPSAKRALEEARHTQKGGASVRAVVYGADWCKPCHDAEAFLKGLGIEVAKKNIETSSAARAEMTAKLKRAGQGGASIPVIDVAGQIFVGFNRQVLSRAVRRARSQRAPTAG